MVDRMLNCKKCKALEEALAFERARNSNLLDRLMALANPSAYQAVKYEPSANPEEFYGSSDDLVESFNEFGERILIKKKLFNERPV